MTKYPESDDNPLVCLCFKVTRAEILDVLQHHPIRNVMDITDHCKAGNGCTSCWPDLDKLLFLSLKNGPDSIAP